MTAMRGDRRILGLAMFTSLLAHLLVLGNVQVWLAVPAEEIPFPIETRLVEPDPPPIPPAPRPVAPPPASRPPPVMAMPITPQPPAIALAPSAPEPSPPRPEPPAPHLDPAPEPAPEPPPTAMPEPATESAAEPVNALPPALRDLPDSLTLRYAVQAGEGGFNLGRARYQWRADGDRYRLESVTEAIGLTSLFISGQIVQRSEGAIDAHGLRPERFSMTRGERKQDVARFDWANRRLETRRETVELPPLAQDLLSFPFHLAMTIREDSGTHLLHVTNGRKLRDYPFRFRGHEAIPLEGGRVNALHLQGARAGEGSLDVWLAPARHWLPVRIRTLDDKGKVLVLRLESVK